MCSLAALLLVAAWLLETLEDDRRVALARATVDGPRSIGAGSTEAEGAA